MTMAEKIISLNIGGHCYSTPRSTIEKHVDSRSILGRILNNRSSTPLDDHGRYFIDRDGTHFRYILNYFRDEHCSLPDDLQQLKELFHEAKFYQLDRLTTDIENRLNRKNENIDKSSDGFHVTLVTNFSFNRQEIRHFIGPLQLICYFHLKSPGKKFFQILSRSIDLKTISCQFRFTSNEYQSLLICHPLNQLHQFILAKQAKNLCLTVSYSDDYIYLPIEKTSLMSYEQMKQFFTNKFQAMVKHRSMMTNDSSHELIEHWFLAVVE